LPKVSLAKTKTVVILILALFAGVSVYWALMQVYQPVPVVTAARDIKEIAQLTEGDLRITEMARRDVHPRACTDPSQVMGQYTLMPITKGEVILTTKVTGDLGRLSDILNMKKNETFLVLPAGKVTWPKFLKNNDLVTVVAFYAETSEVVDVAVGKVTTETKGTPVIANLQSASQGQVPQDSLILALSIPDAHKVIEAINKASAVYLLPRHPALGGYEIEQ